METRTIKVSENPDGHGTIGYRISLPKKWISKLFENHNGDKFVELEFDDEKIILKKSKKK